MLKEMRVVVVGDVQGVGFRATVKREADKLHLKGFVSNLNDGNVEILAQGPQEALEKLIATLKTLFSRHIRQVNVDFRSLLSSFDSFIIKTKDAAG